jgi:hypothetical protein
MSDKNIEMMKKLIEEKKKKGSSKGERLIPSTKSVGGGATKVKSNKKTGGLFG